MRRSNANWQKISQSKKGLIDLVIARCMLLFTAVITPQVNFFCISQQSLAGNNLINLPLPLTTGG